MVLMDCVEDWGLLSCHGWQRYLNESMKPFHPRSREVSLRERTVPGMGENGPRDGREQSPGGFTPGENGPRDGREWSPGGFTLAVYHVDGHLHLT